MNDRWFVQTKTSFDLGKNAGHKSSSLGGRSIIAVKQAGDILAVCKHFKVHQLQF